MISRIVQPFTLTERRCPVRARSPLGIRTSTDCATIDTSGWILVRWVEQVCHIRRANASLLPDFGEGAHAEGGPGVVDGDVRHGAPAGGLEGFPDDVS